nr:hypothetical protein [Sedimentibacter sp.]
MKNKLSINLEVSLVEIILSVLIFAVAGVIMLNCFAYAKYTQVKANDKVAASWIVQSDAEMIKSSKTMDEAVMFLTKNYEKKIEDKSSDVYTNYYDKNWKICSEDEQEYAMNTLITYEDKKYGKIMDIKITVEKSSPYPFVDRGRTTGPVFSIETGKFFPDLENGRQ